MTMNKIFHFSFLIVLTSCNGQEKTKTSITPPKSISSPTVIKNFSTTAPNFDTTLVSQYIRSIFQDSKGALWFGTLDEGVVRYDKETLTYFSTPDGIITTSVFAINEDKNGNLWFGTDQGVYRYDGKAFKNFNQKDGLNSIVISRKSILVDKSGTIWIGTQRGVYLYDPMAEVKGSQSFTPFPLLASVNVAGIFEDKNGDIWFASSDKGVFRYDGKTIVNYNEIEGLSGNYAGGIAQDPAGNMWFTTKNGICKFDGKDFSEYTSKNGLGGTEIWGILVERSGIVWITARGSTTRFDPSIPLPDPKAFTVFTPADGVNCCVQSMFQDQSGNIWLGSGGGLFRFDGKRFYQVKQSGPWL